MYLSMLNRGIDQKKELMERASGRDGETRRGDRRRERFQLTHTYRKSLNTASSVDSVFNVWFVNQFMRPSASKQ